MKAVVFDPQKAAPMMVKDWKKPEANKGEVVVRLKAAALNHRDLNITNSSNRVSFVYGSDGAGVVEQIGEGVRGISIGDEVILNSMVTCMECPACLSGDHANCTKSNLIGGLTWDGTFAEYIKAPARNIVKKPSHLTMEQAAALPMAMGTAWRALLTQGQLKPGQTVLIQGIGGGVALSCLEIAVKMGATVIVTSGSHDKLEKALKLGAHAGINYKEENVIERVKEITNGAGVDIAVASTGDVVPAAIEVAKQGGRIVQFAYVGTKLKNFDVDQIMFKQLSLIGSAMHSYDEFLDVIDFINKEKLEPVVSEILPIDQYEKGFKLMENHQQFGKIVFTIS